MGQYKTCKNCGTSLDPGERCDCLDEYEARDEKTPVGEAATLFAKRAIEQEGAP